jgi:hypothetical protein
VRLPEQCEAYTKFDLLDFDLLDLKSLRAVVLQVSHRVDALWPLQKSSQFHEHAVYLNGIVGRVLWTLWQMWQKCV